LHEQLKLSKSSVVEPTSIEIGGLLILEPVTTVTDLVVTAVCFNAFYHLLYHEHKKIPHVKFYRYYFRFMGSAKNWGE